jgi:hypothetical protein
MPARLVPRHQIGGDNLFDLPLDRDLGLDLKPA